MHLLLFWTLLAIVPEAGAAKPKNVAEVRLPDASSEFLFGAGDRLSVVVYKHDDLNAELVVSPDGTVTMPLVGRFDVAGRSFSELVATIETELHKYYTDASVAVNVLEVSNQKVFVLGEVNQPQVLQITGEMTVVEALARCGGLTKDAKTRNILLVRGGMDTAELYAVNVNALQQGDLSQNVAMQRDDILVIPTKTIANTERFFRSISAILGPFISTTQGYRNVVAPNSLIIEDAAPGP